MLAIPYLQRRCWAAVLLAFVLVGHVARATPPPTSVQSVTRLRYTLESIRIVGNRTTVDRVIRQYIPFEPGDTLVVEDTQLEQIRYRLLGTGFFSDVDLSLQRGSKRGHVELIVAVVERNTLIVESLSLGVFAPEKHRTEPVSPFASAFLVEQNLAGLGMSIGAGFGIAAEQGSVEVRFIDPQFAGSAWLARASLYYVSARDYFGNRDVIFEAPRVTSRRVSEYAVLDSSRFGGTLGTGFSLSLATRILVDYQLEVIDADVPTAASHVRGERREPITFDVEPGHSTLAALSTALVYDTRDAPILPTRGWLAKIAWTGAAEPIGSAYSFLRVTGQTNRYWTLPWKHVVRWGVTAGAIAGDAPFFEQFYVGNLSDLIPPEVQRLRPDRRQSPNLMGTSISEIRFGRLMGKSDIEYRVPLYLGRDSVYRIDLFGSFGLYGLADSATLQRPVTNYSGLARIPLDLTYNLGLHFDTKFGGINLAFGNLLGLIPGIGEEP